eukprot:10775317-Alexandrium_andersonii.AAC.1
MLAARLPPPPPLRTIATAAATTAHASHNRTAAATSTQSTPNARAAPIPVDACSADPTVNNPTTHQGDSTPAAGRKTTR